MFVFAGFYISVNVVLLLGATTRLDSYILANNGNFIGSPLDKVSVSCQKRKNPKCIFYNSIRLRLRPSMRQQTAVLRIIEMFRVDD